MKVAVRLVDEHGLCSVGRVDEGGRIFLQLGMRGRTSPRSSTQANVYLEDIHVKTVGTYCAKGTHPVSAQTADVRAAAERFRRTGQTQKVRCARITRS